MHTTPCLHADTGPVLTPLAPCCIRMHLGLILWGGHPSSSAPITRAGRWRPAGSSGAFIEVGQPLVASEHTSGAVAIKREAGQTE